jgi:hypothetical protein
MAVNKEIRQATERELENWPGVTFTEETGKGHTKVTLHYNGQTRFVIASSTPSDWRSVPNHLAIVRREIRALGAERKHIVVGSKPKTEPVKIVKETIVSHKTKTDQIFDLIGDLRYAEMLALAEYFRDVATVENLRRGKSASWAKMLHAATQSGKNDA